jgi:hypothetical protein
MRTVTLAIAAIAATLAADVQSAQAQVSSSRNPWCIRGGVFGSGSWNCSFRTQQQCLASASGAGGSCVRNPNYQPPSKRKRQ